jgi:hypothetical protein
MKKLLLGLALVVLSGSVHAGNVLVTNYNEDTGAQKPISTSAGALLTGGVISIGSFTTADPTSLIAAANSPAGWAALVADFIVFGTSSSVGGVVPALYQADQSQPIGGTSPLVGKTIYTMIGNTAALADAGQGGVVRHAGTFAADAPLFSGVADISLPTSTVLMGSVGPNVTTVLGAAPSLLLAPIPEPMTATLLLSAFALVARRRRA